jgi:hypothetical protein
MPVSEQELLEHIEEFQKIRGVPCSSFVCPITLRIPAELCDGHILNRSIKSATRKTVIQSTKVDNHFGHTIEPYLIKWINMPFYTFQEHADLADTLFGIGPDGERVPLIVATGDPNNVPFKNKVMIHDDNGQTFNRVIKSKSAKIAGMRGMAVEGEINISHPAVTGSLLKAAYLCMFHLSGYRWVFTQAADYIRRPLAAFLELDGTPHDDAAKIFEPFRHACKALLVPPGASVPETIKDGRGFAHHHDGTLFAVTALFHLNGLHLGVTLPTEGSDWETSQKLYERWLVDPTTDDGMHLCQFGKDGWSVYNGAPINAQHPHDPSVIPADCIPEHFGIARLSEPPERRSARFPVE